MQREHSIEGKLRKLQQRADEKQGTVKVLSIQNAVVTYQCQKHGTLERSIDGMYDSRNLWGCKLCATEHELRGQVRRAQPNFESLLKDLKRNPKRYTLSHWHSNNKATMECADHGAFTVVPKDIKTRTNSYWCRACLVDFRASGMNQRKTQAQFVSETKAVNPTIRIIGEYAGANQPVDVECRTCAHRWRPVAHSTAVRGIGCPKCSWGKPTSKGEDELFKFIQGLVPSAVQSYRGLLDRKEVDIWLPEQKLAIEYNGVYWHSDVRKAPVYHVQKWREVRAAGARMVTVHEDDWQIKRPVVERFLTSLLVRSGSIGARKCTIREAPAAAAKKFLDKYHLQGAVRTGRAFGMFFEKRLVAVMVFDKVQSERGAVRSDRWELVRYASSTHVAGGASRMLSAFRESYSPKEIISYSDNDYFTGLLYLALGFGKVKDVRHDYKVVIPSLGIKRWHKSRVRRSELAKLLGSKFKPELSEQQNCDANGILRVWDSGKVKWCLNQP